MTLSWLLMILLAAPCFASPAAQGEGTASVPSSTAQIQLDGTLYEKRDQWLLFVESDKTAFKKGSVQLLLSKAKKNQLKNYLIGHSYVTVSGKQTDCKSKLLCVDVDSILPTLYQPLNKPIK